MTAGQRVQITDCNRYDLIAAQHQIGRYKKEIGIAVELTETIKVDGGETHQSSTCV